MMKKLVITLCLMMLAMLCCFAGAEEANFYTVTYDSNGHGNAPSMQSKLPGVDLQLAWSRPIKEPYIFYGWATSPDATTPEYFPEDTYSLDQDITLYAIWKEPIDLGTITGNSDMNIGGLPDFFTDCYLTFTVSEPDTYQLYSSGDFYNYSQYGCSIEIYDKYNYLTPIAYSTYISDGSKELADFAITADLKPGVQYYLSFNSSRQTLPLHFSRSSYHVKYDSNGHGTAPSMQSKLPGVDLQLAWSRPIKEPYIFYGWATSPDATTPEYFPEDTYSLDQDITLYAIWKEPIDLGTITGNSDMNIGGLPDFFTDCYLTFTVSEPDTYRLYSSGDFYNYSQYGCSIEIYDKYNYLTPIAYSTYISDGSKELADFAITADLKPGVQYYLSFNSSRQTLPLHFTTDFYIVKYNSNGRGTAPSMQSKMPGVDLKLAWSRPIKEPYIFYGWATSPDATTPEYLPEGTYSLDQDITLYAIWKEPFNLGEITGTEDFNVGRLPDFFTDCYLKFTVSESGTYRLYSSGDFYHYSQYGFYLQIPDKYGYLDTIAASTYISDGNKELADFAITADLKPGVQYYLSFNSSRQILPLHILPQYSDPNPFTASSIVPRSVSIIADSAFEGCGFDSFHIPAGTSSIGARAFADCPNLRKVVIEAADVAIDPTAFSGCTDLLIVAHPGSTAYQFAKAHGFEFRALPD